MNLVMWPLKKMSDVPLLTKGTFVRRHIDCISSPSKCDEMGNGLGSTSMRLFSGTGSSSGMTLRSHRRILQRPTQASDVANVGVDYRLCRSLNFSTSTTSAARTSIVSRSNWNESKTTPLTVFPFNPLLRRIPLQGMNCVERNSAPTRANIALSIVAIPVTLRKKALTAYQGVA